MGFFADFLCSLIGCRLETLSRRFSFRLLQFLLVSNLKFSQERTFYWVFTGFHLVLIHRKLVLLGFTGFCLVLPSFTGFFIEFYRILPSLLGFTGFHLVLIHRKLDLLGFTGFCLVLLVFLSSFTEFYRVYWILPGFTWFDSPETSFTGFYWVLLGFT